MFFIAFASAVVTSAAFPRLSGGVFHLYARSVFVTFSLPDSQAQAVHFIPAATARAALMASHSLGETTATRLPFFTISAVGNCSLSTAPTEIRVEPSVAGRIMRA